MWCQNKLYTLITHLLWNNWNSNLYKFWHWSSIEGPPIPITIDMVKKAISKMKSGKAAGPSGIVVEINRAAGDTGATIIRDLATAIIDDSQFGFVPGRGTTDAIFVVRQLQEKYLAVNKRRYMAFVVLEKAFDCVPLKVIWWAQRKIGVEEEFVRLVQEMYTNVRSRVCVCEGFSQEFEVKFWVHQGPVLRLLLFIIVLEALPCEFRACVPWEDLYADDLVIIANSLEECVRRLSIWKQAMEMKGLRVNAG